MPHLLGDVQEHLDQPQGRGIRLVQQRRVQARHRLSQAVGEPGKMERRLDAEQRQAGTEIRRPRVQAAEHFRQSGSAADRRLLRALHLQLCASAECAVVRGGTDRTSAVDDYRRPHGENHLGPELGRRSGRRVFQAQRGQEPGQHPEGHARPVREHLQHVPAAHLQPLPESGLRGSLPVRLALQARRRRHRAGRPGQVPRLAFLHERMPVQEGVLQLGIRQGREVHRLLPARRIRHADGVFRILRRSYPLQRHHAV